jgi:hypothetical protein
MAEIAVTALGESQYRVTVADGRHRTTHVVTATANDVRVTRLAIRRPSD